jgi:hypothetical protein
MGLITNLPEESRFDSNGILIADGASGTKKISVQNAARDLAGMVSAVQHRSIYGGRNLGSTVTAAQWAAIQNGTFDDLYIGDYWTINGVQWVIADMDYFYNCGDTNFTKHHLVIVPAGVLYSHVMNDSNVTTGGYVGSKMYTEGLDEAKTKFAAAFGSEHILSHRDYLVNAVTDGYPSERAWYDSTVELMNEVMVYGTRHWSSMNKGTTNVNNYTTGKQQLALFQLNPRMVNIRSRWWLRDVVSSAHFANVVSDGAANCGNAGNSFGVRPYAVIGV